MAYGKPSWMTKFPEGSRLLYRGTVGEGRYLVSYRDIPGKNAAPTKAVKQWASENGLTLVNQHAECSLWDMIYVRKEPAFTELPKGTSMAAPVYGGCCAAVEFTVAPGNTNFGKMTKAIRAWAKENRLVETVGGWSSTHTWKINFRKRAKPVRKHKISDPIVKELYRTIDFMLDRDFDRTGEPQPDIEKLLRKVKRQYEV